MSLTPISTSHLSYVQPTPAGTPFGNAVQNFGGWLGSNAQGLGYAANAVGAGLSIDQALSEASRISNLGTYLNDWSTQQGNLLDTNSQFKGYGITTGLGTTTAGLDENGAFNATFGASPDINLNAQGNAYRTAGNSQMGSAANYYGNAAGMVNGVDYMNSSNQAISNSLADPRLRQQEIYDQMMAIQNPELDRQQAMQQAQEYQMGRGGIRGSQYGGTEEDAAMARARVQGSNEAVMAAMKQADAERTMFSQMGANYGGLYNQQTSNLAQIGQGMGQLGDQRTQLGMEMEKLKYLPMDMQQKILQTMNNSLDQAQTGQLTGQGYLSQMLLGGMGNNTNLQKISSELRGNVYNAVLNNLGGATGSDGSSTSGFSGLLSGIAGGLGTLGGWLGGTVKPGTTSDVRLKQNITPAEKIGDIQYYNWDWTEDAKAMGINDPTYGVLAQEMLTQRPEAVMVGDHGYLMVDYSRI